MDTQAEEARQSAPVAPGKPAKEITVAVIGAGIAGLTAALRLAKRGYKVTVYEEQAYIGGNFGAHPHDHSDGTRLYYEHAYHMFLEWYHNFWALAADIGLDRDRHFEPRTSFKHLRQGDFGNMIPLRNPGSVEGLQDNLLCGLQPIPDMFLYSYSLVDLIAQQFEPDRRLLDRYSVTGFMQSRPYATEGSMALHENTLAKAFGSPSYLTSACSYQSFIKYGFRNPEPMLFVLKGDSHQAFNAKLQDKLKEYGVEIRTSRQVTKVEVATRQWVSSDFPDIPMPPWVEPDERTAGRVTKVVHVNATRLSKITDCVRFPKDAADFESPRFAAKETRQDPQLEPGTTEEKPAEPDYVILAVPPDQVAKLLLEPAAKEANVLRALSGEFLEIAKIPKLRGAPMASLDLCFNKRLDGIPKEHVVLLGSRFDLSFIDNSQAWPGIPHTLLNVVASSASELAQLNPGEAAGLIILELKKFLKFDLRQDIVWEKCHFQPNTGDALFLNDVGSEQWRPSAKTPFFNLFYAGDHCDTFVDVVTLEGAVVSGLEAARRLQEQAIVDRHLSADDPRARPIEIIGPKVPSREEILALKLLLAPAAVAAKWWSWTDDQVRALQRGDFSGTRAAQDIAVMGEAMMREPLRFAAEVWLAGWSALFGVWAGRRLD